jgi:hypothetical protein
MLDIKSTCPFFYTREISAHSNGTDTFHGKMNGLRINILVIGEQIDRIATGSAYTWFVKLLTEVFKLNLINVSGTVDSTIKLQAIRMHRVWKWK